MLDGREDLKSDKIGDDENDIEIIDYENFFLINYIGRGTISNIFVIERLRK
jgi:hypothetical protein